MRTCVPRIMRNVFSPMEANNRAAHDACQTRIVVVVGVSARSWMYTDVRKRGSGARSAPRRALERGRDGVGNGRCVKPALIPVYKTRGTGLRGAAVLWHECGRLYIQGVQCGKNDGEFGPALIRHCIPGKSFVLRDVLTLRPHSHCSPRPLTLERSQQVTEQ